MNALRVAARGMNGLTLYAAGLLVFLFSSCGRETPVQLAVESVTQGWKVELLEKREPQEVMLVEPSTGAPLPSKPSNGDKWLSVRLKVTPPDRPGVSVLPTVIWKDLRLIRADGHAVPAFALAYRGNAFSRPSRDSATYLMDGNGKHVMTWADTALAFETTDAQELDVLFSIPRRSSDVRLHFAALPLPVRPSWLPSYPGAAQELVGWRDISFVTADRPRQVVSFYRKELLTAGFAAVEMPQPGVISAEGSLRLKRHRGDQSIELMLTAEEEARGVTRVRARW